MIKHCAKSRAVESKTRNFSVRCVFRNGHNSLESALAAWKPGSRTWFEVSGQSYWLELSPRLHITFSNLKACERAYAAHIVTRSLQIRPLNGPPSLRRVVAGTARLIPTSQPRIACHLFGSLCQGLSLQRRALMSRMIHRSALNFGCDTQFLSDYHDCM